MVCVCIYIYICMYLWKEWNGIYGMADGREGMGWMDVCVDVAYVLVGLLTEKFGFEGCLENIFPSNPPPSNRPFHPFRKLMILMPS